jgi:hypothetical protein
LLEIATTTANNPVPSEHASKLELHTPLISLMGEPTCYAEASNLFRYGTCPEFSAFTFHHGVRELAGRADFEAKTTGEEVFSVNWLFQLGWPEFCTVVLWPLFYFE